MPRFGFLNLATDADVAAETAESSRKQSSADFQSAVSPICNRLAVRQRAECGPSEDAAEYNSALRQIANLRYDRPMLSSGLEDSTWSACCMVKVELGTFCEVNSRRTCVAPIFCRRSRMIRCASSGRLHSRLM